MTRRGFLTGAVAVLASYRAHAQLAVVCPTCSSLVDQITSIAKQAQSYLTQLSQLQTELNMYASMIRNSLAIPFQAFATVQADIAQVRGLANAASLLTGNAGGIIARLNSVQGYANQLSAVGFNLAGAGSQFTMWQNTLGNASRQFGLTLGVQQTQLTNNAAIMAAVQAHSQSAAGQMQAIQAGNELAAANGAVLNQMNETMIGLGQVITTKDIVDADRQATQDAAMLQFLGGQEVPMAGGAPLRFQP
jgi:P-type conjugative transfer protein TrbJ